MTTSICETPECVHAASEILYNLDPNYDQINPCTDFDQYVCGGWRERHDMRPDQGAIFAGTMMSENAQTRLRHLLSSSKPSDPADSNNFEKLKAAYTACMDESTVTKRGSKPLDNMLAEFEKIYSRDSISLKGSDADLTKAILYLMESGVEALVSPFVAVSNPRSLLVLNLPYTYSLTIVTRTRSQSLLIHLVRSDFQQGNTITVRKLSKNTLRWWRKCLGNLPLVAGQSTICATSLLSKRK